MVEDSRERSSNFSLESSLLPSSSQAVPGQLRPVPGLPPPPKDPSPSPLPSTFTLQPDLRSFATPFPPHHGEAAAAGKDAPARCEDVSGHLRLNSGAPPPPPGSGFRPPQLLSSSLPHLSTLDGPNPLLLGVGSAELSSTSPLHQSAQARASHGSSSRDRPRVRPTFSSTGRRLPPRSPAAPLARNAMDTSVPHPNMPQSSSSPDPVATVSTLGARCRRPEADPATPPPPSSSPSISLPLSSLPPTLNPPLTPSNPPLTQPTPFSPGADPVLPGPDCFVRRRRTSPVSDEQPPLPSSSSSPSHLPCSPLPPIPSLTSPSSPLTNGPSSPPCAQQSKDCAQQPRQSSHSPSPNARSMPRERSPPLFEIGQTSFPSNPLSSSPPLHAGSAAGNHSRRPRRPHRIPPPHNGKGILPTPPCHFFAWPPPPPPGFAYFLCLLPLRPFHCQPPVPRRRRRRSNRRGVSGRKAPAPPPSPSADPPPVTAPSVTVPTPPPEQPPSTIVQSSTAEPPPFERLLLSSVVQPSAAVSPLSSVRAPAQLPSEVVPSPATALSPTALVSLPAVSVIADASLVQLSQTRSPLTVVQPSAPARSPSSGPRSTASPPSRPRSFSEAISARIVADLKATASSRLGRAPTRFSPPRTRSRPRLR